MKVWVVGNGIAGNEVTFFLRRAQNDWEITILSAERFPEYDPCSLPYFIGRDVPRDSVFRCKQLGAADKLVQYPGQRW